MRQIKRKPKMHKLGNLKENYHIHLNVHINAWHTTLKKLVKII